MLSLALVASMLAVSPPVLPDEAAALPEETTEVVEAPTPSEPAPAPAETPTEDVIVVVPPEEGALPIAPEAGGPAIVLAPGPGDVAVATGDTIVVVDRGVRRIEPLGPRMQAVPKPPWSGAGRFVGGAVSLAGGVGLIVAASLEFSNGHDPTKPLISQLPAGVVMLVAGGTMIGTAARDQRLLSEWEAATKINA